VHTIGKKQAGTLERFSQGASARIQVNKMKMQMAKDITDLKYPSYDLSTAKPLCTDEEFQ
jgi:hypothetical protein